MLMLEPKKDARSVIDSNYRNIMLLVDKTCVDDVHLEDSNLISYCKLEAHDSWKISQIKEMVKAKAGHMEIPGFNNEELDDLLDYL